MNRHPKPNPNIAQLGLATRWKKGQAPKSPGPKPNKPISKAHEELAEVPLSKETLAKLKRESGLPPEVLAKVKTFAHLLSLGLYKSTIKKGNADAAREITDRIEGRAPHALREINLDLGSTGAEVVGSGDNSITIKVQYGE